MRVRFWGTRGSIATPGPATNHFGGNTSCVEVMTDAGNRLIIDCGTGARVLGNELVANSERPIRASILLSHTHWDHIQGFPFFAPLFQEGNEFTVHAPSGGGRSLSDTLAGQMEYGYFPVDLKQLHARITYSDIDPGEREIAGVRVIAQYLNHPTMTLGYRLEADGASVVYACDHEMFSPGLWLSDAKAGRIESVLHEHDRHHIEFLSAASLLIHDAQYTPAEYEAKKNWGHSTYEYAVGVSVAAGVKQLALTHHDPTHDDAQILQIEREARELVRRYASPLHVFAAFEGCEVDLEKCDDDSSVIPADFVRQAVAVSEPKRILVVDDDQALRVLAKVALNSVGYTVLEASGGTEGLQLAKDAPPDLILLDLLMPDPDGFEVIKELRGLNRFKNLPIIVLTAHSDESHTRAGFDAGANDYLAKPFTIPQLIARVRSCLARANAPGPM